MTYPFIFRPVQASDLPAILEIAGQAGPGFNFLPNDAKAMEAKIKWSLQSFSEPHTAEHKFYFFVLENIESKEIVATSGIEGSIGVPWPFYKFKLSTLIQASESLNKSVKHRTLQLVTEHQNATELGALYLKPKYRGGGRGTFLSRARCLFIAEFQHLFSDKIIADLRGVSDKSGISPFWESLGRQFFAMEYDKACHLKSVAGSQFMIDLMPQYPLYVDLLSTEAEAVLGKTHEQSAAARHILEKEGLQFKNYIDIFDGGPTIETSKNRLKSALESKKVFIIALKEKVKSDKEMLIANTKKEYRAVLGHLEITEAGEAIMESAVAKSLNVAVGDLVRFCPLS